MTYAVEYTQDQCARLLDELIAQLLAEPKSTKPMSAIEALNDRIAAIRALSLVVPADEKDECAEMIFCARGWDRRTTAGYFINKLADEIENLRNEISALKASPTPAQEGE